MISKTGGVTNSLGIVSVNHMSPGVYCVQVSSSIPAYQTGATATPYFPDDDTTLGSSGKTVHVEWAGNCGVNGVSIQTFTVSGAAVANADEPFFFAVP